MWENSLYLVLAAGGILCIMWLFVKNWLIKGVGKAGTCIMLMMLLNAWVPQYAVGLNVYTMGFSAVMGIPGVMTLYVLRMIL